MYFGILKISINIKLNYGVLKFNDINFLYDN